MLFRSQEGAKLGFHGEIWGLPFELNGISEDNDQCSATMTAFTIRTPWKLVKTFSLKKNDPTLYLEETATNLGTMDLSVMWGQHPFFGAPFIDEHCIVEFSGTSFFDRNDKPMVRRRWPRTEAGIDLSKVSAHGAVTGSTFHITDFNEGKYRIVSPSWKLAFEMCWDAAKFPYCWLFTTTCSKGPPWWGRGYGIAVEPFTGLPGAIEEGHGVIPIAAGKSETVRFEARIVKT